MEFVGILENQMMRYSEWSLLSVNDSRRLKQIQNSHGILDIRYRLWKFLKGLYFSFNKCIRDILYK